jgi:GMP synthase (glutamine-hydrolysing)
MGAVYVLGPGGQYNHMICRRVSELGYDAKLRSLETPLSEMMDASAFIVGGGPGRLGLGDPASQNLSAVLKRAQQPVLGICYGHQFIAQLFGGKVVSASQPEFGPVEVQVVKRDAFFDSVPQRFTAWLSHNDEVAVLPSGFEVLAQSGDTKYQAVKSSDSHIYGVQFHVEVEHTQFGSRMLSNFLKASKR